MFLNGNKSSDIKALKRKLSDPQKRPYTGASVYARPIVGVVDTGLCNLGSMVRALTECGADVQVISYSGTIGNFDKLVLPGVGSFSAGIKSLNTRGLDQVLISAVNGGVPLLGVCLGMQLLSSLGSEGGSCFGLGLIEGKTIKLEVESVNERLPHVGWNSVVYCENSPIFQDIPSGTDFYFVHEYHFRPSDPRSSLALTPYCGGFRSAVQKDRVFGVQFHPEKSSKAGFKLLKNFIEFA